MGHKRHVAWFDVHVRHRISLESPLKFLKVFKPKTFILGGDFLDCGFASHWNSNLFPRIGWDRVAKMLFEEVDDAKKVMRQIKAVLPKDAECFYIPGNHEWWLALIAINYPGMIPGLHLDIQVDKMVWKSDLSKIQNEGLARILRLLLETRKTGWNVLPYEAPLVLDKITYLHGHQFSSIAALKRKYPAANVVCGHHHTHDVATVHNSGEERKTFQHVFVPALTHLKPGYLKDPSHRWMNGFWAADVIDGYFDGRVVKVLNGRVIAPGM